jgi:hypothetical protein
MEMKVYTVSMAGGTKNHEFDAYKGLLEEAGVDLSTVPRAHEPGNRNRWLYVWHERAPAERFARELQLRTRNRNWEVHEFELAQDEFGPLAPLDIVAFLHPEEDTFRLTPASQERIMRRFPDARLADKLSWPKHTREDYERQHGTIWNQTAIVLMGLSEQQIQQLGGYRVIKPDGSVLHESQHVVH